MTIRALNTAATGMAAQQLLLDQISHDLANVETTGYKRKTTLFETMISQNAKRVGSITSNNGNIAPGGIQIGLGVKPSAIVSILEQGPLLSTDNPLNIAIQGSGYFQIETPSGDIAYTRDGSFNKNADGLLVTQSGDTVLPGFTIPEGADVSITPDGQVYAKLPGQVQPQGLGKIDLAKFANPAGLEEGESNLLYETAASGAPTTDTPGNDGMGTLAQGYLEGSNVNAISAVTKLISAQRAFEMNTKAAKTAEDMLAGIKSLGA